MVICLQEIKQHFKGSYGKKDCGNCKVWSQQFYIQYTKVWTSLQMSPGFTEVWGFIAQVNMIPTDGVDRHSYHFYMVKTFHFDQT